ncbi:MAG: hypothetical protein ACI9QD_000732 [Thermoproteota archaeon]|jgi:hypothetical protein
MKYLISIIVLILTITQALASTEFINIDKIHPTQFSLGMLAIKSKIKKVEKAFKKGEIISYLKSKSAPAVIGPDGKYYITDRHHTSFSIYKADIPKEYKGLYLKVKNDWSKLCPNVFANKMIADKNVWLRDEHHTLRDFFELPTHISQLTDDAYRSLAWKVRKSGGFNKVNVSFLESYWGMYFKEQGIILHTSDKQEIKAVLSNALSLSKLDNAAHLPGYKY